MVASNSNMENGGHCLLEGADLVQEVRKVAMNRSDNANMFSFFYKRYVHGVYRERIGALEIVSVNG